MNSWLHTPIVLKKNVPILKERIARSLNELNNKKTIPYEIDFSIGYSRFNSLKDLSIKELIRLADEDMYKQKNLKKTRKSIR